MGGCALSAVVWLAGTAPPGTTHGRARSRGPLPRLLLFIVAGLVFTAVGVVPVRRLYSRGRPLSEEAGNRQYTDPRPQQFDRMLLITAQLAIAVAILASSGLMLLASAVRPVLPEEGRPEARSVGRPGATTDGGGIDGVGAVGQTVVGKLASTG